MTMAQQHAMQMHCSELQKQVACGAIQSQLDVVKLDRSETFVRGLEFSNNSLHHQLKSANGEVAKLKKAGLITTTPNTGGGSGPSSPKVRGFTSPPREPRPHDVYHPNYDSLGDEELTTVHGQRLPSGDATRIVKIANAEKRELILENGAAAMHGFTLKMFCDAVIQREYDASLALTKQKQQALTAMRALKEEKQEQLQHATRQAAAAQAALAARAESELARLAAQSNLDKTAQAFQRAQEEYKRMLMDTGAPPTGEVSHPEVKISPTIIDGATSAVPVKSAINLVTQSVTQKPTGLSTKALLGFAKPATPDTFRGLGTDKINVWLKEVENYLTQCGTHDSAWVGIGQSFLKGQALTVWTDTSSHFTEPPSWHIFRSSMMEQYGSYDVDRAARKAIKLVKQGNTSAADYVKAFKSVLSNIKGMDERTIIEQFIDGLNPDLQLQCSYDHSTQQAWTSLKELARVVSIVDNERVAVKSNTNTLKVFSTAVQPRAPQAQHRQASTSAPNGRRPAFPGGTQGPPTDSTFRIQGPKQPNTAAVIAEFKRRGMTQDTNIWKRVLAEWLRHTKSHGVCNRCARKHVVGECQIVNKSDWVIAPLLFKPELGSTGI